MEMSREDGQYVHEYITIISLKFRFHSLYEHFLICYGKDWVKAEGNIIVLVKTTTCPEVITV